MFVKKLNGNDEKDGILIDIVRESAFTFIILTLRINGQDIVKFATNMKGAKSIANMLSKKEEATLHVKGMLDEEYSDDGLSDIAIIYDGVKPQFIKDWPRRKCAFNFSPNSSDTSHQLEFYAAEIITAINQIIS